MTLASVLQAVAFFVALFVLAWPLGNYIAAVFEGGPSRFHVLDPLERRVYWIARIDPELEMSWQTYAFSLLSFTIVSIAFTYAMLRLQQWLPFNPQRFPGLAPDLAWNTAVSFATTTDWQFYAGESTMSYLSQMTALAWQNFVAAGVGVTVAIGLIRGLSRQNSPTIGNFWVDLTRALLYVLLPLSIAFSLAFVWQGVPQNFHPYSQVATLDGAAQTITGGPMASQESIKLLGGNGGGFVAANSASPNENPTPLSNFLQLLAMFLIPASLVFAFGRMVADRRQGWAILAAMTLLFVAGAIAATIPEIQGNPLVHQLGVSGGNMEGKETRFGVAGAGLSLAVATDSTVGASNFAYESLMPLASLIAMVNMQLGEVAFGGVGSGLFGMLAFVLLTVFVAGLLVGRTPEYIGNKIERREITFVVLAILAFPVAILIPSAVAAVSPPGLATLGAPGPAGFSEIIYAFTSSAASNGSAFGGLGANTFYNIALGLTMLIGRYAAIIPTLALAGAFAAKARNDYTSGGMLQTWTPLFAMLLVANVIIVGALTFLPADALGPIAQQLIMRP